MCLMNRRSVSAWLGIFWSLFLIAPGFAQKKASVWGDAKRGIILSYRPCRGDLYVYERTLEGAMTMERMGQTFETTNTSKFVYQLETDQVDTLINFVLTVDTIGYSFEGPQGTQSMEFGDIKGKKVRASMTSLGESKEVVPIDSLPTPKMGGQAMEGDAKGWLSAPFFKLPDKALKIGDTWTEAKLDTTTRTDTTRQSTQTYIKDSQSSYTVLGEETKMGLTCLHIQVATKYSSQSHGKMRDSEISAEGDGETKSQVWFAYQEGILVEYLTSDFYEGTTAFSGQMNMTSPNSRETKSLLKLVKWVPAPKSGKQAKD